MEKYVLSSAMVLIGVDIDHSGSYKSLIEDCSTNEGTTGLLVFLSMASQAAANRT